MRMYEYFNSRYDDMKQDLKHIEVPMSIKVRLLQEIQDTVMMLKKIFQDDKNINQRSLISGICKSVQLSSSIRFLFLVKFLKDLPGYTIDQDYITKNFKHIKNLSNSDCSKFERERIIKGVIKKEKKV